MSAARTIAQIVDGTGTETDSGPITPADSREKSVDTLVFLLDVTSLTGTAPTFDAALEWSFDDGATWVAAEPAVTFTQATGATQEIVEAPIQAPLYRWNYTWGGTITDADLTIREHTR